MNQAIVADRLSSLQSLLQGIQHEVGSGRTRHLPADNAPGKNVNHEGDIDEALPSRDLREIRYPQRIWAIGSELPMHAIQWARRGRVAHRGFDRLTAHDALQTIQSHQPLHRAVGHVDAFAPQLTPDLAGAVDLEIVVPDLLDWLAQALVK